MEGTSGCQHGCNNTIGGFLCSCPEGQGLRDDGLTCGTICYTCENVLSNDECNEAVICSDLEVKRKQFAIYSIPLSCVIGKL